MWRSVGIQRWGLCVRVEGVGSLRQIMRGIGNIPRPDEDAAFQSESQVPGSGFRRRRDLRQLETMCRLRVVITGAKRRDRLGCQVPRRAIVRSFPLSP